LKRFLDPEWVFCFGISLFLLGSAANS